MNKALFIAGFVSGAGAVYCNICLNRMESMVIFLRGSVDAMVKRFCPPEALQIQD